ncbi:hypothetical protein RGR602_PC01416 (plasmid) [Rhizobium gallicum bv. gallicum R602sp]|uniref:Uncharacterized protein n=1 Tax=Rhizobium gallicum bv. gallicum R602sp TaxID=1041138 RepID=A0A0B4XG74_9HYPH|nr:hypothetical protein RGR602_PC01416 [Rhizobium gallicum bv. gallicum R602sp]
MKQGGFERRALRKCACGLRSMLTLGDIQQKIIRSYIRERGSRADPFEEDA